MANRHLDVVAEMEDAARERYGQCPPRMDEVHKSMLALLPQSPMERPDEVPEAELEKIYEAWVEWLYETAPEHAIGRLEIDTVKLKIWPELKEVLRHNPALTEFMRSYGTWSRFAYWFILTINHGDLAEALLAAQFVGRNVLGEFQAITPDDGAFLFCAGEESFDWVRFRAQKLQQEMQHGTVAGKPIQRILFAGAGLDPALWTRDFELAEGQSAVMFDQKNLEKEMTELMGQPLNRYRIDYQTRNCFELAQDPALVGQYDLVALSGVACYFPDNLRELLIGAGQLVRSGGSVIFDLQVRCLGYLFDARVLEWPASMSLEFSHEAAVTKVGTLGLEMDYEVIRQPPVYEGMPCAGALFRLTKPLE